MLGDKRKSNDLCQLLAIVTSSMLRLHLTTPFTARSNWSKLAALLNLVTMQIPYILHHLGYNPEEKY